MATTVQTLRDRAKKVSRFKKERLLRAKSEDAFRDEVLRPLLLGLGYRDGRDLCGPTEHGKDAIFVETNKLGALEITALQSKIGNISLAGAASKNVITVCTQLQTALVVPYFMIEDKRKVLPSRVILATSGKISDTARRHIEGSVNSAQLTFMDADSLIPLIDEVYPELWLDIDAKAHPYLNAVIERYSNEEHGGKSTGLAPDILLNAATDTRFVGLNVRRTVLKTIVRRGQADRIPSVETLPATSLVTKAKGILLLGDAGAGKSTTLKRIAINQARQRLDGNARAPIPIIVRAAALAREDTASALDIIMAEVNSIAPKANGVTTSELHAGLVTVLIDALDELKDDTNRRRVATRLHTFSQQYPLCQVILTSREQAFVSKIDELATYIPYTLDPINAKQITEFIERLRDRLQITASQGREVLRRIRDVHGMELTPLLVTVFLATTDATQADLPANISELFKKFTDLLLGRWDEAKGVAQQYQARLKEILVQLLAFEMHKRKITAIELGEFHKFISHELQNCGLEADYNTVTDELINRSSLFRVTEDTVEFRHHLLQEFFAGSAIPNVDFIEGIIEQDWWRLPIVFYFGAQPNRDSELTRLLSQSLNQLSEPSDLLSASFTLGLALQASYFIGIENKKQKYEALLALFATEGSRALMSDEARHHPYLSFLTQYVPGIEALALNAVRKFGSDFGEQWVNEPERLVWLAGAFIQIGDFKSASRIVGLLKPLSEMAAFGLHLSLVTAEHIRDGEFAESATKKLHDAVDDRAIPAWRKFGSELKAEVDGLRAKARDIANRTGSERVNRLSIDSAANQNETDAEQFQNG